MKESVKVSVVQLCLTLWNSMTIVHQAPLSIEFSRQEYWNSLPFSAPEDFPDPGIESKSLALQADSLPLVPPGKSTFRLCLSKLCNSTAISVLQISWSIEAVLSD